MKNFITISAFLIAQTSFAESDARIVGAVFSDKKFISIMGGKKLTDIEIKELSKLKYSVIVNDRARLADGCSYTAIVTESPHGRSAKLEVTKVEANCPQM